MQDETKSRRSVLKKLAGTASLASVGLAGGAQASDVTTETYVCEGTKDCCPDPGECSEWTECKCERGYLLERECSVCDCDGCNEEFNCADWVLRSYYC